MLFSKFHQKSYVLIQRDTFDILRKVSHNLLEKSALGWQRYVIQACYHSIERVHQFFLGKCVIYLQWAWCLLRDSRSRDKNHHHEYTQTHFNESTEHFGFDRSWDYFWAAASTLMNWLFHLLIDLYSGPVFGSKMIQSLGYHSKKSVNNC